MNKRKRFISDAYGRTSRNEVKIPKKQLNPEALNTILTEQ